MICVRVMAKGRAGVKVNEMRVSTGVSELGASVKVTVGSSVFVGLEVGEGIEVLDGISVGVATERPDRPQPVNRESSNTKQKIRMCFNDMFLNKMVSH